MVIGHFRKSSFNIQSKITQIEIQERLNHLDHALEQTVSLLIRLSNAIQIILLPKLIYALSEKKKIIVRCNKKILLNSCAILAQSTFSQQNIDEIITLILNLNLPRYILNEILESFIEKTVDYPQLTYAYVHLGEKIKSNDFTHKDALNYSNISNQMLSIENSIKTNRAYLYSLIKEAKRVSTLYIKNRNVIVNSNLSICYTTASKLSNNQLDFEDNYQNSTFGLIRAYELYDQYRGVPFDKYALYWAGQSVREKFIKKLQSEPDIPEDYYEAEIKNNSKELDINRYIHKLNRPEKIVLALNFGMYDVLPQKKDKLLTREIKAEQLRQEELKKKEV